MRLEREDINRIKENIDKENEVMLFNMMQVAKYILAGVEPIRYFVDEKTLRIIFVFKKEDTREVYEKWLDKTL